MTTGRPTAVLGGLAVGLALSPFAPQSAGSPLGLFLLGGTLGLLAPAAVSRGWRLGALAAVAGCAAIAGIGLGELRLQAIDAGALVAADGERLELRGFVLATPRRADGRVSIQTQTASGRILVEASEPVADLAIGDELLARGTAHSPAPWQDGYLRRLGIARVLDADTVDPTGIRRGGLPGVVDDVRREASTALGRGTTEPAAALVRGFVLGEDDRIDAGSVSDFRRSGLAHLLAVSGENVALLALLAAPFLALLGLRLRVRLALLLALILIYVLVTGASPSIQRAGVMGAASVIATMAGRPRARWHVILLAAAATLSLNPRATGDPGWQLSFAAVVGIMLAAAPIRDALLPPSRQAGALHRALAEGAGVTIAATLATAPLIAVAFDNLSLTSLPANLLALPAVAPVMWLGMATAALGQIPLVPVAPISWLAGALSGYIAQVAHWLGAPSWAQTTLPSVPAPLVVGGYAVIALSLYLVLTARRRHRWLGMRFGAAGAIAAAIVLAGALAPLPGKRRAALQAAPPGLRAIVLDVGQGDAILLEPRRGAPLLVDGGPPGDDLAGKLRALGVERLGAALVTHDQSDHAGGVEALLGSYPVKRLILGARSARLAGEARQAGVSVARVAQGDGVRSGALRLQILWPPRALESKSAVRGEDPNLAAVVAVARWHSFSMLLTADAEAESVPTDPGAVDVLKVAHHGSADAGLAGLLERSRPGLAVISVGAGNPYGHPDPSVLKTLRREGVPVLRTDLDGTVEIDARRNGWSVASAK